MNKKPFWVLYIILVIIVISGIYYFVQNPSSGKLEDYSLTPTSVVRIIDGDTFELGSGEIVRLLCIDTPEKNEEVYKEATSYLENFILYREVILEGDVQNLDKYGRALRYVYLNDSGNLIFINKEIYKAGYAQMMIIPPSIERCEEIKE